MASANVIDLVSSPVGNHRHGRSRNGGGSYNCSKNNNTSNDNNNAAIEVIDLQNDTYDEFSSDNSTRNTTFAKKRKTNGPLDEEVEILEVLEVPPSHAAYEIAAKSNNRNNNTSPSAHPPNNKKSMVRRIRNVFPYVNRGNAERIIDMAMRYSKDGDLLQLAFAVLAEDPTGNAVTDTSVAAAVVGGRVDGDSSDAATLVATSAYSSQSTLDTATGNLKVAQLECQCCYVEYDFENMVSCRGKGHLFCRTCLQKHVEQRVFGLGNLGTSAEAFEISCMHSSGCKSGFHEGQMRQALPEKVMKKYDEMRYMAVVEKAAMKDACKCPKCQYLACADESLVVFHCPQCDYKSCRKCGEEAHPGIRCDQVETKDETDGRKIVEEAMTKAKIRSCPRPGCETKFCKSDGCNKMTCPKCRTLICYICRNEIPKTVAYGHFCQTPHCRHDSCKKCPLYTNDKEDDKRAVREAGLNAAKSVKGKKEVNVDVDSLLKDPMVA
mmetsp:Transcript_2299/g.4928  ORF Transcript_2299/g.4928 Transcript_2299/m.4928 type:complete len:493 (+) Transcript_2299:267-1745(+)